MFWAAEPGLEFVITCNRPPVLKSGAGWAKANLRTRFEKIIKRAGLKLWPRLWHNLRACRQTELADLFPSSHVVCRWISNSEDIVREHHLSVTPEHIERAINGSALPPDAVLPPYGFASRKQAIAASRDSTNETAIREKVRPLKMDGI